MSFLHLIPLFFIVSDAAASAARPGCPEKCGNVTIPYPFGFGKECCLNKSFEVTCNAHAVIEGDSVRITVVAIPFVYRDVSFEASFSSNVSKEQISYLGAGNKLVIIGCDGQAYLIDANSEKIVSGCTSRCSVNIRAPSTGSGECALCMIVEQNFSHINKLKLSTCEDVFEASAILDWSIGNISCHEAANPKDYICGQNSRCVNSSSGNGYLCACLEGYQGNPYHENGCQDIDECEKPEQHQCPKGTICVNTPGNFSCGCPSDGGRYAGPGGLGCVKDGKRKAIALFVSLGVGLTCALVALVSTSIWLYQHIQKRKQAMAKKMFFKRNGGLLLQQKSSSTKDNSFETKYFVVEDLEKATDNFSENGVLGKGGLGTVYKGMLSDGRIVAIKKSNKLNEDQVSQFINEILILSQIDHRHIVKILGCCLETEVPLLVYEYIPNGTLAQHLQEDPNSSKLSWEHRLRIATEVAGALAYLHSYASTAIFHRDIKSSNILLDDNFRAVVSDFGLSRSVPIDKTHLTTLVGGTFGYLDPEYWYSGQLNDKSDVYSFGVVLVELLTRQKAVSSSQSDEGLVRRFRSAMKQSRLLELVDRIITNEVSEEEIRAMAELAKRCLKRRARKRPGMKEVAAELEQLRRLKEGKIYKECVGESNRLSGEMSSHCSIEIVIEASQ